MSITIILAVIKFNKSSSVMYTEKLASNFSHMSKSNHKFAKYSNMGFSCQIVNQA